MALAFQLSEAGSRAVIEAQANGTSVVLSKMYLSTVTWLDPQSPPSVPQYNTPTAIPSGSGGKYTGTFYWDESAITCESMIVSFDVDGHETTFAWGELANGQTITFDSSHTTQMVAFSYNFTTGNGFNVEFDKAATYASLIGRSTNDLDEVGSLNKPVFLHEGKFIECTNEVLGPWFNYGFKHSSAPNNQETFESESIRPITEFKNRKKTNYKVFYTSRYYSPYDYWDTYNGYTTLFSNSSGSPYEFTFDAYSAISLSYNDSISSNKKIIFFPPNEFRGDVIQNSEQPSFYFRKVLGRDQYCLVTDGDVSNWIEVEIFYAENNCCPIIKLNSEWLLPQTKSEFTASYYETTCDYLPTTPYAMSVSIRIDNHGGSLVVASADSRFWNSFQSIDIWYPEASLEMAVCSPEDENSEEYNKKASLSTGPVKVGTVSFSGYTEDNTPIYGTFIPNEYFDPADTTLCLQLVTDDAYIWINGTDFTQKSNIRMSQNSNALSCDGYIGSLEFTAFFPTDGQQCILSVNNSNNWQISINMFNFDIYSFQHSTVKSEFVDCKTLVGDGIKMPVSLNPSVYIESTQFDDMTSDDPDAHSCYVSDATVNFDSIMPMSNVMVAFYDSTTGMSSSKLLSPQDWIAKDHSLSKAGIESFAENCYVCLLGEPEDYYYASTNSNINTCMVLEFVGGKSKLVFYGRSHTDSPSDYFSNCTLSEINIPPKAVEAPGVFCQAPVADGYEKQAALLNSNSLALLEDYGSSNKYRALRKSAVLSTERLCFSNYTWDDSSYAYGVEFFDTGGNPANFYYCSKCTFDILPFSSLSLTVTNTNSAQTFTETVVPSDWSVNGDNTVQINKRMTGFRFSWHSTDRHLRIDGSAVQYVTFNVMQYKKNYSSVFPAIQAGSTTINQDQVVVAQHNNSYYTVLSGNEIELTDSNKLASNNLTANAIQITQSFNQSASIRIYQNQFQNDPVNNKFISLPTINIPPFSKFIVSDERSGTNIHVTPQCWRQDTSSGNTYLCVILENLVERWTYDTYTGKLTITILDTAAFVLPSSVYISVDYKIPSIIPSLSLSNNGIIINSNGIGIRSTNISYANATFLDGHDITIDGKTILYGITNDTGANIYSNPSDYLVDTAGRPILLNAVQIKEMIDAAIQAANS